MFSSKEMKMQPQISIIIVNYNSGVYVVDCVQSLQKQEAVNFEIIVVDNASQDDSVKLLKKELCQNIQLIESSENLGFGRANNLAVSKAQGEYLLLLNPDTVIDAPYALRTLIDTLKSNPKVGMLGPAIVEPRKNKQVLPRNTYPSAKHLKYTDKFKGLPGSIAWLLGACLLFRRSVFNEIKGFDPDYFLYGEDADIGLKVRLAGYEIAYCDTVKITHVSGVSEFGANTLDKWLRKKRGLFLFCAKHFHRKDAIHLANMSIMKSRLYLVGVYFMGLFHATKNSAYWDKLHRFQATIIAAKELKARLVDT